jgi:hypothetical protein
MSIDFGNAFIFSNPDGLDIALQHSVHLDGEPSAPAKEADGSVLFVTKYGLYRITKSGELQRLTYFAKWIGQQHPNSMAVSSDGSIFIAMRMFVLRLRSNSGRYTEEWLLPNECRKFAVFKEEVANAGRTERKRQSVHPISKMKDGRQVGLASFANGVSNRHQMRPSGDQSTF